MIDFYDVMNDITVVRLQMQSKGTKIQKCKIKNVRSFQNDNHHKHLKNQMMYEKSYTKDVLT